MSTLNVIKNALRRCVSVQIANKVAGFDSVKNFTLTFYNGELFYVYID